MFESGIFESGRPIDIRPLVTVQAALLHIYLYSPQLKHTPIYEVSTRENVPHDITQ